MPRLAALHLHARPQHLLANAHACRAGRLARPAVQAVVHMRLEVLGCAEHTFLDLANQLHPAARRLHLK
jgi:hypothetical protein